MALRAYVWQKRSKSVKIGQNRQKITKNGDFGTSLGTEEGLEMPENQ